MVDIRIIQGVCYIKNSEYYSKDKGGKVEFVEFVGATDAELVRIMDKKLNVKDFYEKLGSDITDYNRESLF